MKTTPDMPSPTRTDRWLADAVAVLPSAIRLFPTIKPPNIVPVGALSLLGGARQPLWQALLTPLLVMAVTDYILKITLNYTPFNPYVYASFALTVLLGRALLRGTRSWWRIGSASLAASTLFYLVTNFGVWYAGIGKPGAMYSGTAAGLLTCYVQGIPFFGLTALGDLGCCFALFAAYDWITGGALARKPAAVEEAAK
ncbi:MAG: DUF6580 family putative transport protein [Gemmataceae bacterium]